MTRRPMMPFLFGLATATALLGAPAAGAAEPSTVVDLLWVTPRGASGAPAPCARLLLVEAPVDWISGDAAAVVLTVGDADEVTAARVAEAMLAQQAAVLHLRFGRDGWIGGCNAALPEPPVELAYALDALRREGGAGLVVVIGIGAAGSVALGAAAEAASGAPGTGGSRLAAAVAMGGQGPAAFL
ncbi:hypothetical protein, partial [Neoroseomonas soli]